MVMDSGELIILDPYWSRDLCFEPMAFAYFSYSYNSRSCRNSLNLFELIVRLRIFLV